MIFFYIVHVQIFRAAGICSQSELRCWRVSAIRRWTDWSLRLGGESMPYKTSITSSWPDYYYLAPTRCPRATINVLGTRPQPHLFEQPVPSQDTTCPQGAVAYPEPFDTKTQKRWGDSQRYDRVARHRKKPICIRVWWAAINCLWS